MKYLLPLTVFLFSSLWLIGQDDASLNQTNFTSENVMFQSALDGTELHGTLTIPTNTSKPSCAVLISGSGPQDRDSELLGQKPFLELATHLSSQGIAVLRVDDRGAGESGGEHNAASLEDFKNDALGAFTYLQTRTDVNQKQLGLIGHSLGGVIAPMIAAENKEVAYIILLAGSGIPGDELMLLQKATVERKMGIPEMAVEIGRQNFSGVYEIITSSSPETPKEEISSQIRAYFQEKFGAALPEAQIDALSEGLVIPWLMDFIKYDPSTSLEKVTCPTLVLNGSLDLQVPPKENLAAIEAALIKAGNTDYEIHEIEGVNHLFQPCETGLPDEYDKIEGTYTTEVLELMTNWIKSLYK